MCTRSVVFIINQWFLVIRIWNVYVNNTTWLQRFFNDQSFDQSVLFKCFRLKSQKRYVFHRSRAQTKQFYDLLLSHDVTGKLELLKSTYTFSGVLHIFCVFVSRNWMCIQQSEFIITILITCRILKHTAR